MTNWNGYPPESQKSHHGLHVIASALGRNPTVFRWDRGREVWINPDSDRKVSPREMKFQSMTYLGSVQS